MATGGTTKLNIMLAGQALAFSVGTEPPSTPYESQLVDYEAETTNVDDVVCYTIGELRWGISQRSRFDGESMKLIYKGKMLGFEKSELLSKYGFKDGEKVMGLGKPKTVAPEDAVLQKLRDYEKQNIEKLDHHFKVLFTDFQEIEQDFLNPEMTFEMISRLKKRVQHFNELGEKQLVSLDAIEIYDDSTPEPLKVRNREVRKRLVNRLQDLLNLNDKFKFRLEELETATTERQAKS